MSHNKQSNAESVDKTCGNCGHAQTHKIYDDGGYRVSTQNIECDIFKDDQGDLFISPINNPGCLRWKKKELEVLLPTIEEFIASRNSPSLQQELEFLKNSNCPD